jgi:ABC-type microcin C transport system permease subunit YejB
MKDAYKMTKAEVEGIDEGGIMRFESIVKSEKPVSVEALFHFGEIGVVVVPAHDEAREDFVGSLDDKAV